MNKNFILKSDVLDIIFEKRNKLYGAYNLRKFYPGRLKLALGFMFITAISFSAFTLLPENEKEISSIIYCPMGPELKEIKPQPKEPEKKPEVVKAPEKPALKQTPVSQTAFTNNFKIVDDNQKTDTILTLKPEDKIGTTTIITPEAGPSLVNPMKKFPGGDEGERPTSTIDKSLPMDGDVVDILPAYPGGMDALRKFLEKNLQTPTEMESGETVSVRVKFVVDYMGKLKSFVTVQDGGEVYNKEVVRVLKKMPDWVPGKTKGENVSVYYIIPVKFTSTE